MKQKLINLFLVLFLLYCAASYRKESPASPSSNVMDAKKEDTDKKDKKASTWKKGNNVPNTPKLFVGDKEELTLAGEEIRVQVDGFRARVLLDCYYLNDKGRILEGNFKLQLPLDASPYYFAFGDTVYMDDKSLPFIESKPSSDRRQISLNPEEISKIRRSSSQTLKEARVVPKEKSLYAYEETVRKNVDPAILEWAGADVFTGRVFPLQAGKLHRISIGYDVNLLTAGKEMIYSLSIPKHTTPQVINIDSAKIGKNDPGLNGNLKWNKSAERLSLRLENPKEEEVIIRYPHHSTVLKESGTDSYFATNYTIDMKTEENNTKKAYAVFALDISKSSNPDKFSIWVKLMETILKNNRNTIPRFAVLFFNIEAHWWKEEFSANTPDNMNKLLKYVDDLALVGATDLNLGVIEASKPSWFSENKIPKNVFLLSDGSGTWGESDLYAIKQSIPEDTKIFAYRTGLSGTDTQALEFITKSTGGAFYSVVSESEVENASRAYLKQAAKLDLVQMNGASDILISGRPNYVFDGQELIIAGRGEVKKDSFLTIQVSVNGAKRNFKIPFQSQIESNLTSRVYGQIATSQLEEFSYLTEEFSKKYAMHFAVAGQTCSFLILESEADYQRFGLPKEELLSFIRKNQVDGIIGSILKQVSQSLLSKKAGFLNWITELGKVPGITVDNKKLTELATKLKEEAFQINAEKVQSNSKLKSNFTGEILKELSGVELSYALFSTIANKLANKSEKADGLKVLSSLVETNPGDGVLARDISYSASNWNFPGQAYYLLRRAMKQKPFEPQTYHLAAQCLAKLDKPDLAILFYEIAYSTGWDARFGDFNEIVAIDYLHFLNDVQKNQKKVLLNDFAKSRLASLKEKVKDPSGFMVAISWNTDRTDVDLHVIEPSGEECFYNHRETRSGGSLTRDVTQGYGPELYVHPDPPKGKYKVTAHYFASDRLKTSVATKVKVTIYKNRGKQNETVSEKVITLETGKSVHEIDIVEIE